MSNSTQGYQYLSRKDSIEIQPTHHSRILYEQAAVRPADLGIWDSGQHLGSARMIGLMYLTKHLYSVSFAGRVFEI